MILMVLESFRTCDRLDLVFGAEHLHKLTYPGDRVKPESVPQEEELRDTLYRKLKGISKG